jgi:transaldolase
MKATQELHDLGQSLWLDNITRAMLGDGTLEGYIEDLSVTGLTSNPSIFDKAISESSDYDQQIGEEAAESDSTEELFFKLAIADLSDATKLFADVHKRTDGVDGWCSLEVSPTIADDAEATKNQAKKLHGDAARDNLYIKIPGTPAGLDSIEESIYAGIPINVTLLFDADQYLAAADAYMKGIERRIAEGKSPGVASVASIFMSRWDVAVAEDAPDQLVNRLGIAIGGRAYKAYRELLESDRWLRLANAGARPQRLLWASTGTKDPNASDTMYVEAFAAPFTVNTMPEGTLKAYADHGKVGKIFPPDGGNSEQVLAEFEENGFDVKALAERLQGEGKESFVKSWKELMESIEEKRGEVAAA